MSIHGFMSQIGGQLGLFLGGSFLSIFQCFMLIVEYFCSEPKKVEMAPPDPKYSMQTDAKLQLEIEKERRGSGSDILTDGKVERTETASTSA